MLEVALMSADAGRTTARQRRGGRTVSLILALLACLALLVVTTYLRKKGKPIWFTLVPAAIMFVITGFAMRYKITDFAFGDPLTGAEPKVHLLVISVIVVALELWMVVEAVKVLLRPPAAPAPEAAPAGEPAKTAAD